MGCSESQLARHPQGEGQITAASAKKGQAVAALRDLLGSASSRSQWFTTGGVFSCGWSIVQLHREAVTSRPMLLGGMARQTKSRSFYHSTAVF